ncbi:LPXTG cell wall anchor domain-containing protein, partial [Nocardiopsis sp. MG754419]|uniref:LPXTG cell wall anchor domain-containing protein n=1 Tax=Nocardiopsis sp. MG754419 TaxID=2259865 RepID=UPI0020132684
PSTPEDDATGDDETSADTAAAESIDLDEEGTELVDGGDTIVIEATISGASVSTSQSWDGNVAHDAFEGELTLPGDISTLSDGEEITVEVVPVVDQGVVQVEDAGYLWNDAYTNLYLAFSVDGEVVNGYPLAESAAGITTAVADGGGEGDDGSGDDKTPPRERDKDTLPATDVKDAEPLAQTGSPIIGLIAAGAAIAAGGGAAAYLARRKKNAAEADENATAES